MPAGRMRGSWSVGALLLALGLAGAAQALERLAETPQFRRFGVDQGLPSSRVYMLAQDREGYLWIGTNDGLARYDGVGYRVWRYDPGVVDGMPGNSVQALLVDRDNTVWMGISGGGLAFLDHRRQEVQRVALDDLGEGDVWGIAQAGDGTLWVGTFGAGLYRRGADGRFEALGPVPTGVDAAPQRHVLNLATDRDGVVWIGTMAGLARVVDGRIEAVATGEALDRESIMSLTADPDGTLWMGTRSGAWQRTTDGRFGPAPWADELRGPMLRGVLNDGRGGHWIYTERGLAFADADGLRRFDTRATREGDYLAGLRDPQGGLWFGDVEYGLVSLPAQWRSFTTLSRDGPEALRLSMREPWASAAARDGGVWLGGPAGTIDRLDRSGQRVERGAISTPLLGGSRVRALYEQPDGVLWVGAMRRLLRRDTAGQWRAWDGASADPIPVGAVDAIVPMDDGSLWISLYGGGLQHRDGNGGILQAVPADAGLGLTAPDSEVLRRGPDGALWVGNSQGILRWNGQRFETLAGPTGGSVQGLAFAGNGTLWAWRPGILEHYAVEAGGLRLIDAADSGDEGLPPSEAGGIVVDRRGRVWITSVRGLVRYDPATRRVRSFGPGDGLVTREFGLRAPLVLADGRVVAATADGAVLFDPAGIDADPAPAPLVIESIGVRRAEDLLALDPRQPVVLQPQDRDLRVTVRLMSFADPSLHRYRFRLDGYDPDWVEVGPSGERSLPRQAPGRYTLHVVAARADGQWGKPLQISVQVLPPWYQTWWAIALYAVIALLLLAAAARGYRRRVRAQAEHQRAAEARRLAQQASDAKSAFLADLGHELRTPLTGVLGMTELMLHDELPPHQRQRAETVLRAGRHLLHLVNDTLDLARVEAGRLLLHDEPFDLPVLLADVGQWLRPLAASKGLDFAIELATDLPREVCGDAARLRQILLNLGGNAIKFTARGGVRIAAQGLGPAGIVIEVIDTGIGLSEAEQQRMFQRFEQAEGASTQRRYGGSGLGLAISRELARAMGGELSVQSHKGEGSCFRLALPLPVIDGSATGDAPSPGDAPAANVPAAGARILLVEDDPVVAEVVVGLLQAQGHRVLHAAQAMQAMALLRTEAIDLALFDLDLPAVDGFDLARMAKAAGYAGAIVALTARGDADSMQAAQDAGMAGYLRKPVDAATLAAAVARYRG